MKKNSVSEIHFDFDGSVFAIGETITLAEGVKVDFFTFPGASKPHEIALTIGDEAIVMKYTEEVAGMLGRLDEISALDLLSACYRTLWQMNANIA